jgi:amino acid permease
MIGSGLVSLPWAFERSGFLLAVVLCFVGFLIGFYTCYLVVNSSKHDADFQKTLFKYLGRKGWSAGLIATIIIFIGAAIVYFVIQT